MAEAEGESEADAEGEGVLDPCPSVFSREPGAGFPQPLSTSSDTTMSEASRNIWEA